MLSMLGGGFGGGGSERRRLAQGASFIQGQYSMFQQILKVSIRKVTLTVKWQVIGSDRDMKVVAFFTDAAAMDKVLSGLGSQELPARRRPAGGSGSGSGSAGRWQRHGRPPARGPGTAMSAPPHRRA